MHATGGPPCSASTFGYAFFIPCLLWPLTYSSSSLLASGHLRRQTAPSTSMVEELVLDMMAVSPDIPELEVAMALQALRQHLAQNTKRSSDSSGRPRSPRMNWLRTAGFNGRGRPKTQTSGHTRQDFAMDGYLRTPPAACFLEFAVKPGTVSCQY
jgi:hypothetical protein